MRDRFEKRMDVDDVDLCVFTRDLVSVNPTKFSLMVLCDGNDKTNLVSGSFRPIDLFGGLWLYR